MSSLPARSPGLKSRVFMHGPFLARVRLLMLRCRFAQSFLGLKDCAGYHTVGLAWGPRNPYYENGTGQVRTQLGYVPRTENHAVAQLLDRGEKLSARIVELNDGNSDSWEWEWVRVRFEVLLEESSP